MTSPNAGKRRSGSNTINGESFENNDDSEFDPGDHHRQIVPYAVNNNNNNHVQNNDPTIPSTNSHQTGSLRETAVSNYQSVANDGVINGENYTNPSNSSETPPGIAGYSANKVRVALILVATFSSAGSTIGSVLPQYLLERWSNDSGHSRHDSNHTGRDGNPCVQNSSDPWNVKEDHIEAEVSMAIMHYNLTTFIPALLACLIYGALVDIVGRRPVLISSLLGSWFQLVVCLLIIRFKLNTNYFFLAYALDGLGGSFFVNLIAGFAITADISDQKDTRIIGIAALGLVFSVMYAAFNIMIGLLIKKFGFVIATYAIIAPFSLAIVIAIFFLPETLPVPKQKATLGRLWDYTKRIVFLYSRDGERRTRRCLLFCLFIFFCGVLNIANVGSLDTLFQQHSPFCWDSAQIGYYSAFRNSGGYALAFGYLCIWRCIGCSSDEVQAMVGMLFIAGSCVLEAFVTKTWQMYMVPIVMSPGSNLTPIMRGVMSVLAGPDKQGVMFSSVALIEVLCGMTATIAFNKIYAATVSFFPGFVYLVMAGNSMVAFLLFIPFFHYYDGSPKTYEKLVQAPDVPDALSDKGDA